MVDVFIELAERLKGLETTNTAGDAAALLTWLNAGGLQSLEPDLERFLIEKTRTAPITDAKVVKSRADHIASLRTQIDTTIGRQLFKIDSKASVVPTAVVLAALGFTPIDLAVGLSPTHIAEVIALTTTYSNLSSLDLFVRVLNTPWVTDRWSRITTFPSTLTLGGEPQITTELYNVYAAGRGYTLDTIRTLTRLQYSKRIASPAISVPPSLADYILSRGYNPQLNAEEQARYAKDAPHLEREFNQLLTNMGGRPLLIFVTALTQ